MRIIEHDHGPRGTWPCLVRYDAITGKPDPKGCQAPHPEARRGRRCGEPARWYTSIKRFPIPKKEGRGFYHPHVPVFRCDEHRPELDGWDVLAGYFPDEQPPISDKRGEAAMTPFYPEDWATEDANGRPLMYLGPGGLAYRDGFPVGVLEPCLICGAPVPEHSYPWDHDEGCAAVAG